MNGTTKPAVASLVAWIEILRPEVLAIGACREAGQRHGRREVGHDAEIEDEHVADEERHAELEQSGPASDEVMM